MSDEPERKVAICGTAPSSLPDAPLDDPDWEIWGTSRLWKQVPRQTVWFELHDLDKIGRGWDCTEKQRKEQAQEHIDWMAEQDIPIYLQDEDDRVPSGVAYPIDEIRAMLADEFGDTEAYFTNSIAYMLAMALYQEVDRVGIYGVDMALNDGEYQEQRPSVEYWIGLLRGAGIEVDVPASCDLLQTSHLYAFEYEKSHRFQEKMEARQQELDDRVQAIENKIDELAQVRAAALTVADKFGEVLGNGYELPEGAERDMRELTKSAQQQGQQAEAQLDQLQTQKAKLEGAKDNAEYVERSFATEPG